MNIRHTRRDKAPQYYQLLNPRPLSLFIAIEMFRESDKVSGISRCCSYVSSLCVLCIFLGFNFIAGKSDYVVVYKA